MIVSKRKLTKRVLIDVVHGVVTVPTANYEHRILANNRHMPKSVQRLRACRLNQFPLKSTVFQRTLPEVIKARMTIVTSKNVHRAFKNDCGVVCARRRCTLCTRLYLLPPFLIQIVSEEVIEVVAALSLISPEKVEWIHVGDSTRPRSLHWLLTARNFNLLPPILPYRILIQIIESFIVICPSEQVYISVGYDALVAGSWTEYLSWRLNFVPLTHAQIFEVLIQNQQLLLGLWTTSHMHVGIQLTPSTS